MSPLASIENCTINTKKTTTTITTTSNNKNNNNNNNNKINTNYNSNNNKRNYGYMERMISLPYNDESFYQKTNSNEFLIKLAKDDAHLLEQATRMQSQLHKSHSYSETMRPKATIIKQDSLNGRVATSLTERESAETANTANFILDDQTASDGNFYLNMNNNNNNNNNDEELENDIGIIGCGDMDEHEDSYLLPTAGGNSPTRRPQKRRCWGRTSSTTSSRASLCYRVNAFITRNWYLNYLVPITILIILMLLAYWTRDYAKRLLFWIEKQNPWVIFAIFMVLFIIVSYPVVVGYFVLMITSGYLFGFFKGLPTVILGANVGIALAHLTIRSCRHRIPLHRLIKNETGRAILRVISGPRAFRVVLFTRLTPIPFGIQNAIFGVSSINPRVYHTATFLGLLPAQIINVYLGSTLRSMHEVLNSHGTAVTGYISFAIEVVCGVGLMFWVVQKARKELSETILACSSEDKTVDVQV